MRLALYDGEREADILNYIKFKTEKPKKGEEGEGDEEEEEEYETRGGKTA